MGAITPSNLPRAVPWILAGIILSVVAAFLTWISPPWAVASLAAGGVCLLIAEWKARRK